MKQMSVKDMDILPNGSNISATSRPAASIIAPKIEVALTPNQPAAPEANEAKKTKSEELAPALKADITSTTAAKTPVIRKSPFMTKAALAVSIILLLGALGAAGVDGGEEPAVLVIDEVGDRVGAVADAIAEGIDAGVAGGGAE